jgi:hypothetical protein
MSAGMVDKLGKHGVVTESRASDGFAPASIRIPQDADKKRAPRREPF